MPSLTNRYQRMTAGVVIGMLSIPAALLVPTVASASPMPGAVSSVAVVSALGPSGGVAAQLTASDSLTPVTGVSATPASPFSVALSWTNPGTAAYKGVAIRRAGGTTPPATITDGRAVTTVATPGTTVTNTGLSAKTTYSYSLFAHDGQGNYAAPATVTVTTPVDPAAAPTLSEQREVLRTKISAAKQDYIDSRPFIALLARADGLALKNAIAAGTVSLDKAALLVTNATTQTAMDTAASAVATEVQRATTVRASATNLKSARDLRTIQQEITLNALTEFTGGRISESTYQETKTRAGAFSTLLASDTKTQLAQLGKTVKPVALQASGWSDELEQNTGTIPTVAGWVGFPGGCALPAAAATFRPQLPANGPGVATNAQLVTATKARGETHATLKPIHEQMLRSATAQASETLTLDQLRSGYVPRIARLGYGWLEAGDAAAKDKLQTETRQVLEAGPEYTNTLTTSHLLLAAGTAADWSGLTGMDEVALIRWIGPHTCLHADRENFVDTPTNIAAIHNSASFVASAVFLKSSPEQAAALAKESLTSVQPALKMILTDGGTKEGPGYWTYQSRAIATLYSTLPNAYASMPIAMPSMAKVSDYALNSTGPNRLPTPFADALPEKLSPLMPAWDAFSRNDPAVGAWVERELKEKPDAYLMWWYTTPSTGPARKSTLFPYTGFAALHASTTTATLKGGDNAANHAHLDLGSVSLFRGGVQWSVDPGTELNNPAGYYGDTTRWTFWKPGTSAHSTLSIAGANQPLAARAEVTMPSAGTATVNMVQALPGTSSATRTLRHSASQSILTDTVRSTTALPLQWQWVTDAQVVVEPALNRATLKKDGKQIVTTFTGVPAGSTLSAVAAPGTGPDGAPLTILKLVTPKVTSLDLVATITGAVPVNPEPAPQVLAGGVDIAGTFQVGQTLTAQADNWQPAPVTMTYEWFIGEYTDTSIPVATGGQYTLKAADLGKKVSLLATGTKEGYESGTATSATTAAVTAGTLTAPTPTISGTPEVGSELTASPGTWTAGTTLSYQWLSNGSAISGATAMKYTLTDADAEKVITVVVTGAKAGYTQASKTSAATAPVAQPVTTPVSNDFNGDGYTDVLARDTAGKLWLYAGNGKGGWLGRTQVGSGWQGFTSILTPGDFNGDGNPDVLGRDSRGGYWLYPGNGNSGWLSRVKVGSGWQGFTALTAPGDFNGDGNVDVLARDSRGGFHLYPGNGAGGWKSRVTVGSGWNGFTSILGPGDFNGDGAVDVLARHSTGALYLYAGNGAGGWKSGAKIGSGWQGFTALVTPGDFNGDGGVDVLARDRYGVLWLYGGNGSGGWNSRIKAGSGWNIMNSIS